MIKFYESHINTIEHLVEILFEICLYVVIFLGHKVDTVYINYSYKLFFVLMAGLGVWLYDIKNESFKNAIYDILGKLLSPFLGALIIAKLTGKIDVSDILPALYIIPIVFIHYLNQKPKTFKVKGKKVKITPKQFLKEKIGKYAILDSILIYLIAIIIAYFNLTVIQLLFLLFFTESIIKLLYLHIVEKFLIK